MTKKGNAKFAEGRWRIHEDGSLVGYFSNLTTFNTVVRYFENIKTTPTRNSLFVDVNDRSEKRYTLILSKESDKRAFFAKLEGKSGDTVDYPTVLNDILYGKCSIDDTQCFITKHEPKITADEPFGTITSQLGEIKKRTVEQKTLFKKTIKAYNKLIAEEDEPILLKIQDWVTGNKTDEKTLGQARYALGNILAKTNDPENIGTHLQEQIKARKILNHNKHNIYTVLKTSGQALDRNLLKERISDTLSEKSAPVLSATAKIQQELQKNRPSRKKPPVCSKKHQTDWESYLELTNSKDEGTITTIPRK